MQSGMMRRIAALLTWKKSERFHCGPTGMTMSEATLARRNQKIARFYEQGASKERVEAYLRRWLGWAGVGVHVIAAVGGVGGCGYGRDERGEGDIAVGVDCGVDARVGYKCSVGGWMTSDECAEAGGKVVSGRWMVGRKYEDSICNMSGVVRWWWKRGR